MIRCIALALFAVVIVGGIAYWAGEQSATYDMPLVRASAADDSRLYALCPTIVPWQAPKYVKEHKA